MQTELSNGNKGNTVVVLDFGSQVAKLIANEARKAKIYSVIFPFNADLREILEHDPVGIILSGGPASVLDKKAPSVDLKIFRLGIPVLGICYGHQLMAHLLGGYVEKGQSGEYGRREITTMDADRTPLEGFGPKTITWMSHGDQIVKLPPDFEVIAKSQTCPVVAMADKKRRLFGLQFHPEVEHTVDGDKVFRNFLINICRARGDWTMASFKDDAIEKIRKQVGESEYVLGLVSGGVDSSTMAVLMYEAIGNRFIALFVDNGLLRKNERAEVEKALLAAGVKLRVVDVSEKFLRWLRWMPFPEWKRKVIGRLFIKVAEKEAKKIAKEIGIRKIEYLAQGTLYPDVIESISEHGGPTHKIKSHHNVGALPKKMKMKLIEPFRGIFKDEVRLLAQELGIPKEIWARHPFPGPGEAIRCLGRVTKKRLTTLREADVILIDVLHKHGLYYKIGQAFAVLPKDKSVGVMGDARTYENFIIIRCVDTSVYMTADWTRLLHGILDEISNRIVNEVKGINRVVYDITSKPPGTIEWE
ncbi:glutamine-hydrolyzing GMP synthase [Candidatus Falkowbacteria bacterium CG11_big_fil_rev_8_21_14_0_20_39_10]|uniref:GMP synthase [glutamine-hydrolyzing] n=1 Tax=Candidatus Falkowbacteria bacterium CG11_big_fil_rev_8_21_14_0_20_39_10 TaxID=1974570 RepID=A0A2M6K886_9BACT|nr:MAG: glutamine-hydrolyzing GMP synthase [Candidatus Falkowbacteria bacterium CG11_big_fil_rev_8_21_14_0_20_39_10]